MRETTAKPIPLHRVFTVGGEGEYLTTALRSLRLSGDGPFTKRCHTFLENRFGCAKVLLTPSCTAALEMAALLFDIQPGDEVIMPSYTFVSTANAFLLRGAKPVFADILPDTLCLDPQSVARAVTPRTKAIVPVHYAGNACDMDAIMAIAGEHGLLVVEDAAQGFDAKFRGRALGTIGHLGTFSFHETKNVTCGEGGALLINDSRFTARAEIIREKGTDRSQFLRGETAKYTWQDAGSSFLPSELQAAFLLAQFDGLETIRTRRRRVYDFYESRLRPLERAGLLRLPCRQSDAESNHHLYFMILGSERERSEMMAHLETRRIQSSFHFVPLHGSPLGRRLGGAAYTLPVTDSVASRLLRLPAFAGLEPEELDRVCEGVEEFFAGKNSHVLKSNKAMADHHPVYGAE